MNYRIGHKKLAEAIMGRATCHVMVGAVIVDCKDRVVAVGWNSSGPDGYGLCAERMAIRRANRKRLPCSTIYIAGKRKSSGNWVEAIPCEECMAMIRKYDLATVYFTRKDGSWGSLMV